MVNVNDAFLWAVSDIMGFAINDSEVMGILGYNYTGHDLSNAVYNGIRHYMDVPSYSNTINQIGTEVKANLDIQ